MCLKMATELRACAICKDVVSNFATAFWFDCLHTYHLPCIVWARNKHSTRAPPCPECRSDWSDELEFQLTQKCVACDVDIDACVPDPGVSMDIDRRVMAPRNVVPFCCGGYSGDRRMSFGTSGQGTELVSSWTCFSCSLDVPPGSAVMQYPLGCVRIDAPRAWYACCSDRLP